MKKTQLGILTLLTLSLLTLGGIANAAETADGTAEANNDTAIQINENFDDTDLNDEILLESNSNETVANNTNGINKTITGGGPGNEADPEVTIDENSNDTSSNGDANNTDANASAAKDAKEIDTGIESNILLLTLLLLLSVAGIKVISRKQ